MHLTPRIYASDRGRILEAFLREDRCKLKNKIGLALRGMHVAFSSLPNAYSTLWLTLGRPAGNRTPSNVIQSFSFHHHLSSDIFLVLVLLYYYFRSPYRSIKPRLITVVNE